MIVIVVVMFLIAGIIAADAVVDYVFLVLYALAVIAILNNLIHLVRCKKKHGKICGADIKSSLLYLLMGLATVVVHCIWF